MSNILIAINGKARAGKDFTADFLCSHFGFVRMALADPLKKIVMDSLELSEEQLYGKLKQVEDPRYGKTPRWLLQYLGTDVFRNIYEDIWVDKLMALRQAFIDISAADRPVRVVVPDLRFENEMRIFKEEGGYLWRVKRLDHKGATGGMEDHASECELDDVPDSKFDNVIAAKSGDLEGLLAQAGTAARKLVGNGK